MATTTVTGAKLASKAKELAYPYGTSTSKSKYPSGSPTSSYKQAVLKDVLNGGLKRLWSAASTSGASCDVFVGTVVRSSGVDKNFPVGLWKQLAYMEKHMIKINAANIDSSKLKDGDIGIYRKNKKGKHGHIFMYAYGKIIEASAKTYWPRTNDAVKSRFSSKGKMYVYIFRFKDSNVVESSSKVSATYVDTKGKSITGTIDAVGNFTNNSNKIVGKVVNSKGDVVNYEGKSVDKTSVSISSFLGKAIDSTSKFIHNAIYSAGTFLVDGVDSTYNFYILDTKGHIIGRITEIADYNSTPYYDDYTAALDLRQTASRLYSSNNYQYLDEVEKEQNSTTQNQLQTYINTLKNAASTNYNNTSNTFPEKIVTSNFEKVNFEANKPKQILSGNSTNLLSYPTLVEAPTIVLDFNGIKIGGYGNSGDIYPNYINSMSVKKINGRINQYSFNLSYQVRYGEDPNFIDKLISRVGYTNPLKILYGDSNYSGSYYKEEYAVITDVKQTDNVKSYTINYDIQAMSSIAAAQTSLLTFGNRTEKPSNVIYDLLYSSGEISKNLIELFPGMKNKSVVSSKNLIPTNDSIVNIGGMKNTNPINYLSHLVSCMSSNNNSTYFLSLIDNSDSNFNGAYFKIDEIICYNNINNINNIKINNNYYTLDIGYPSNNFIMDFKICNNDYWPLVYKYGSSISYYDYNIDNNGNITKTEINNLYKNNKFKDYSLVDKNWWRQVTEFPISVKVTLKGLLSPIMLMSYIKINTIFYGQKDMASGLYVVTEQNDTVSKSGYSTELTLLRVLGDE